MNRKDLENQIEEVVSENGMEVVEINVSRKKNPRLEVLIYKEDGVGLDDCQLISKELESKVDLDEYFKGKYNLEIASPGLDRKLTNKDDYRRNLGNMMELRTYATIDGKKEFYGILSEYDDDKIVLENDGELKEFDIDIISVLRRYIEF